MTLDFTQDNVKPVTIEPEKISAFIICCNEEKKIQACLEALSFCDEIVVVDSGSTDKTLEIAKKYTSKIVHRAWNGFVAQKQYGLDQCTHPWVLNIDADEIVSPSLRDEILAMLKHSASSGVNGYALNRVTYHLERFWHSGGWYPEFRLRLIRKKMATWGGIEPHEKAEVFGEVRKLQGELYHYTYDSIFDQVVTINKFSSISSASLEDGGEQFSFFKLLGNPFARFFKFYLLKGGYKEGIAGIIVAGIEAFGTFLKYAKLWEKKLRANSQAKKL